MPDSSSQSRYRHRIKTEGARAGKSIFLSLYLSIHPLSIGVIESLFVSDIVNPGSAGPGDDATADAPRDGDPAPDRCIWPGCTRPRAPGRVSGSGRQKEYCLQADPPEDGGGPVHNARNRWAALRNGSNARLAVHDHRDGEGSDGFAAA